MSNKLTRMQKSMGRVRSMLDDGNRHTGSETEYGALQENGMRGIDYDRIAEITSQRPVVVYVDKKAAATLLSREMDTAIGNRNIRQLVSMGG